MLPILTSFAQRQLTPAVAAPAPTPLPVRALPPVMTKDDILPCLTAFKDTRGIDFTLFADELAAKDYTPDIIPEISIPDLCAITGAVEGQVVKFKIF